VIKKPLHSEAQIAAADVNTYWKTLIVDGRIPSRMSLDPGRIAHCLRFTGIIELAPPFTLRIIGTDAELLMPELLTASRRLLDQCDAHTADLMIHFLRAIMIGATGSVFVEGARRLKIQFFPMRHDIIRSSADRALLTFEELNMPAHFAELAPNSWRVRSIHTLPFPSANGPAGLVDNDPNELQVRAAPTSNLTNLSGDLPEWAQFAKGLSPSIGLQSSKSSTARPRSPSKTPRFMVIDGGKS
jgi:hypothetical protein